MPAKTLFIVQQFDRVGKKLVAGRQMEQPSAGSAQSRAERDATRCAGVVAIQQTVDTETGEALEKRFNSLGTRKGPAVKGNGKHEGRDRNYCPGGS